MSVRADCAEILAAIGKGRLQPISVRFVASDDDPAYRLLDGAGLLRDAESFEVAQERAQRNLEASEQLATLVRLIQEVGGVKLKRAIDAHHDLDLSEWGWQ